MPEAETAVAPTSRRRFQFTIRRLFILVAIVAIPFAWWGWKRHQYESRWQGDLGAVAAFEAAGGFLVGGFGDVQFDNTDPAWVRRLVGDRYLENVGAVIFDGQCSDANVRQISRAQNLVLEIVRIVDCPVSGDGLAYLADFRHLQFVQLYGSQFTNDDLKHMLGIPKLKRIRLIGDQYDNQALETIGKLNRLDGLWLWETQVTDDGLRALSNFKQLKWLDICDTPITDAGLIHLTELTELEELDLLNTKVTNAGVDRLQKSLPHCEISR